MGAAAIILACVLFPSCSQKAVDAKGRPVPKDHLRRIESRREADRPLQAVLFTGVALPLLYCYFTQKDPTVTEQLSSWWRASPSLLSGFWLEPGFLIAAVLLSIERMCYTWVHVYTPNFVTFCQTPLGKYFGKTDLDVVYFIFCINKWIQSFTFPVWWFYTLGDAWPSTIYSAIIAVGRQATRFQWTCLLTSVVVGQGLNLAACAALGKPGIFYGHRLGLEVPWVTGFPFSVMPHAQYTGMCIFVTCWNAFMNTTVHIEAGLFASHYGTEPP